MSEVYTYSPTLGGRPLNVGAAAATLTLHPTTARTGVPLASSTVNAVGGSWQFLFDPPAEPNRYYALITYTAPGASTPTQIRSVVLDLPTRYDLLVSVEELAIKLGVPMPLTDTQRARLEQEIEQVQTDAAEYINRAIFPEFDTVTGLSPQYGRGLLDWRAWPILLDRYDDQVTILAARDTGAGYDVDVMIGLDGRNEPALARYVLAAAAAGIRADADAGMGSRQVVSVSAEGQSVSYDKANTDADAAGAPPTKSSLDRLRRHSVYRNTRPADPPFPYRSLARATY